MLRGGWLAVAACLAALPACRRTAGSAVSHDAGALPLGGQNSLCVERPEGCIYCEGRGGGPPLLEAEEPRPSLCNPKDEDDCVDFCSRLTPECATSWRTGASCLLGSEREFRRALFWRDSADRPEAVLVGRVVDENGRRIEGARVAVWASGTPVADETSARDGTFRIRLRAVVTPYSIRIQYPGLATEIAERRMTGERADRQGAEPRPFRLGPESSIRGRVVDGAGAGVTGVMVQAVRTAEDLIETGEAATGEDGAFVLRGLEARRYHLRASKFGWQQAPTRAPIAAPATRATLKLVRTGVIRGAVVDADGEGEPNATVVALLSGLMGATSSPVIWTADSEGAFSQDRFSVGTYYLWARHGEMLAYPPQRVEITEESLDVDVKLALSHRGARVAGQITPREGFVLEPERLAMLRSRSPLAFPGNAAAEIDQRGRFVVGGVLPGRYEIHLRSGSRPLGISRGPREVEVPIDPGSTVTLAEPIVVRPQLDE